METEVIIALVVSGLAFLGTIVSLIVSFISQKSLNEKQFKEKQIFKKYELYIDKKHEAYLKLWANLIEAISAVNNQRGLKELMPLGEMDKNDFRQKLTKLPLTNKQKTDWIEKFDEFEKNSKDRKKQNEAEWLNLLGRVDVIAAIPIINNANYNLVLYQPFINYELDKKYEKALSLLRETALIREIPSTNSQEMKHDRKKVSQNLQEVETIKEKILIDMRKELASGNYQIIGK